jgi:hypothetical protein
LVGNIGPLYGEGHYWTCVQGEAGWSAADGGAVGRRRPPQAAARKAGPNTAAGP